MDKQTLSNYGWIVIAVLVLAVMIALATPFGTYIKSGVESTTQGLFDTSEKAIDVIEINRLKGNSVCFYGDSIGYGATTNGVSFAHHITESNDMSMSSFCTNGKNLEYHYYVMFNTGSSKNILKTLTENDYVIVEGFVNDIMKSQITPLGNITADGATEFDKTTFIGMLEGMIYDYKQADYKAKLGFILTYKCSHPNYNDTDTARQYWDAAISVFEKYSIPYLDLYSKEYSLTDGVHPDEQGQIALASDVEKWMNSF